MSDRKRFKRDFTTYSSRHQRRIVDQYMKYQINEIEDKDKEKRNNIQDFTELSDPVSDNGYFQDTSQSHSVQDIAQSLSIQNIAHFHKDLPGNEEYQCEYNANMSSEESLNTGSNKTDKPKWENLRMDLASWAVNNNITHKAMNELFQVLSLYAPTFHLPKDARTLVGTPRSINYENIQGGEYLHFGLKNTLISIVAMYERENMRINNIEVSLNIDGLPLSRSSSNVFWPILMSEEIFKSVYIVGIFYGRGKPKSANELMQKFVDEWKNMKNTFIYKGQNISVNMTKIICDAPAKAFLLHTKGHAGYSSCSKCMIVGQTINKHLCFPFMENPAPLRTDEDFRQQKDKNYHTGKSCLLEIENIGLVSNVPLDYMHLICLGVMKKLLLLWTQGPLSVRISASLRERISEKLTSIGTSTPIEFSRKPRSLKELKYWKASEFRSFLLYTGPIVLQPVLQRNIYEHFLCLHVAISILITPTLISTEENIQYAQNLLQYFVKKFDILYGKQFASHNIHNLLHICDDIKNFGALDNYSAFHFENFLGKLKKVLRKAEKPLQQLAKRYGEMQYAGVSRSLTKSGEIIMKENHENGPIVSFFHNKNITQYKKMQNDTLYLNCNNDGNNCVMLKNEIAVSILNIIKTGKDIYIVGHKFNIMKNLYKKPCPSSFLQIFIVTKDKQLQYWPMSHITHKLWVIKKRENAYYAMPLRHKVN
ncbi:uncharacterized protein LOC143369665 isoform X1 [Andrena cerasifolii]|uniref:uncharacterized protein LOC143369665 isoform X1 n=1 Tax=Andrena cerasifolii TaxID=2819439 RepID=UPI004037F839